MEKTMDKIIAVAKARGFVYPGSEIYGGLANTWDYGNLGVELKNNVKKAWWKKFIQESPYNVGVDCAILMNPQTWVASGHLGSFSDPLMDCKECKERFRADKIIEDFAQEHEIELESSVDGWSQEKMKAFIDDNNVPCPSCGKHNFTDIRQFNLMFKTFQGVTEDAKNTPSQEQMPDKGRRDTLKTLATVPILGALAYGVYQKRKDALRGRNISDVFQVSNRQASYLEPQGDGKKIRIGLVGFGIRGKQLMRAAGFAEPSWIDKMKEANKLNKKDTRYQQYMEQDDLNIEITAVCDIFDVYGEAAVLTGSNIHREGSGGKFGPAPKRYRTYQELVTAPDVDAVIIAGPDHWHSTIAMAAARAGKHVYCEKPLSWTVPETYMVRQVIKETGVVFQLGHQGRQTDCYQKAEEIIGNGLLGPVNLIEVCTNRNSPNGAWVYDIIEGSNPNTIDWKQFEGDPERIKEYMDYMTSNKLERYIGPDERSKFSLERFFRWRCWWDYSTGLSGDLLTHEYDAVNQIMHVGIPHSATSSGGVYFFKDGRTVPDVLQTTFEWPDRDLTMLYSATLASSRNRGKVFMGHDASMEVSNILAITVDQDSTRYADKIKEGIIPTDTPFYTYVPGQNSSDSVTSPTELYFAKRGLLYTYVNGKRYDTTHLHIREWLECIRQGKTPSCNIDAAFQEAMTAHMGTRAYLEGRTMYWDKDKEEIVRGELA